jgi:chromosome segregation ATPase
MTDSEVKSLKDRLDLFQSNIETKLEAKFDSLIRLEEHVKYIAESLNGCPMCKNAVTTHSTEIETLKEQIKAINTNLESVWKRLWAFAWVSVIVLTGIAVSVGGYVATH